MRGESVAEARERLRAVASGHPFLVVLAPDGARLVHVLAPGAERVVIGRRSACDVALPWDREVSRAHAVVERVGGEWVVADEGISRNGTFLNGERVSRARLADRDQLRLGRTLVTYHAPDATAAGLTEHADAHLAGADLTPAQRRVLVALCRPLLTEGRYATPATNQEIAEELVLSVEV